MLLGFSRTRIYPVSGHPLDAELTSDIREVHAQAGVITSKAIYWALSSLSSAA